MLEEEINDARNKAIERYNNRSIYSPMMQHYIETKAKYVDCILCYRLGDFFEMFFEDAIICSRILELTLTGKECGLKERAPMCGIPHHAIDSYITKLVNSGLKVAICEQLEDPKLVKGIVKRDVIKIVTPGTVIDENSLEQKKNNYIMSIYKEGTFFGLSICDISTGDFLTTEIKGENNFNKLLNEISRFTPSEIVVNRMMYESKEEIKEIDKRFKCFITVEDDYIKNDINIENTKENIESTDDGVINVNKDSFAVTSNNKELWNVENELSFSSDSKMIKKKFEIKDKDGKNIDIEKKVFSVCSINGLMNYLESTQKQVPQNLTQIIYYEISKYMVLDISTRRNLEITERLRDKSKKGTLLWVLDKTQTAMGGRLLRRWINDPLIETNDINQRLDAVEELKNDLILRDEISECLKKSI